MCVLPKGWLCAKPYYSHSGCCHALLLRTKARPATVHLFTQYFMPKGKEGDYWFGDRLTPVKSTSERRMNHRVYALLIAAEIAKES